MTTVRDVHPYVIIGGHRGDVMAVVGSRMAHPEDDEDIDALPVVEQAAILCSIFASDIADDLTWDDVEDAIDLASIDLAAIAHHRSDALYTFADGAHALWAEAEARLRAGEVG